MPAGANKQPQQQQQQHGHHQHHQNQQHGQQQEGFQLTKENYKSSIEQMMKDIEDGFIPTFVVCTLGTTGLSAYDDLEEGKNPS